jgi:antitoxin FitA
MPERDMCQTCVNVTHMKMIQVRNVPDGVHRELKARAARRGVTLTDYVLDLIESDLARPTLEEALERISRLPRPRAAIRGAELVREAREEREEELAARLPP